MYWRALLPQYYKQIDEKLGNPPSKCYSPCAFSCDCASSYRIQIHRNKRYTCTCHHRELSSPDVDANNSNSGNPCNNVHKWIRWRWDAHKRRPHDKFPLRWWYDSIKQKEKKNTCLISPFPLISWWRIFMDLLTLSNSRLPVTRPHSEHI